MSTELSAIDQPTQSEFDYDGHGISKTTAKKLEARAKKIEAAGETLRRTWMDLAEHIAEAQSLLSNNGNGTFGVWCSERLGITRRHANRLAAIHERFGKIGTHVSQSSPPLRALTPLASEDAPQDVVDEVVEYIKTGGQLSERVAKSAIEFASSSAAVADLLKAARENPKLTAADIKTIGERYELNSLKGSESDATEMAPQRVTQDAIRIVARAFNMWWLRVHRESDPKMQRWCVDAMAAHLQQCSDRIGAME
jgi:hypothetical protein